MPKIIAVANQKGGVGKTSLACQMAFDLALRRDKRVLFIDMDAQGNGSRVLCGKDAEIDEDGVRTVDLFDKSVESVKPIPTPHRNLDIIPTKPDDRDLYGLEMAPPKDFLLAPRDKIQALAKEYDVLIIDTPPNLGLKLYSALLSATHVLCPIRLCGFAEEGYKALMDTIENVQLGNMTDMEYGTMLALSGNDEEPELVPIEAGNPCLQIIGALINGFDNSKAQKESLAKFLSDKAEGEILKHIIRSRTPLDTANLNGLPVWEVRSSNVAASELREAFDEIYDIAQIEVPAHTRSITKKAKSGRR